VVIAHLDVGRFEIANIVNFKFVRVYHSKLGIVLRGLFAICVGFAVLGLLAAFGMDDPFWRFAGVVIGVSLIITVMNLMVTPSNRPGSDDR
jgi:hypothetical protein